MSLLVDHFPNERLLRMNIVKQIVVLQRALDLPKIKKIIVDKPILSVIKNLPPVQLSFGYPRADLVLIHPCNFYTIVEVKKPTGITGNLDLCTGLAQLLYYQKCMKSLGLVVHNLILISDLIMPDLFVEMVEEIRHHTRPLRLVVWGKNVIGTLCQEKRERT